MFEKNSLFYAANIEPEITRMFRAYDNTKYDEAEMFKNKSLEIISNILSAKDISTAGREEWFAIRNLIDGYRDLDQTSKQILLSFGKPFSQKFMNEFGV
jgi:hypothetical protein